MGIFSMLDEAFGVEFFQQSQDHTLINEEKNTTATSTPLFCKKGHKFEGRKCVVCDKATFQNLDTPHRNTECKPHPALEANSCKDGEYFFKSQEEKTKIYNNTKDRVLTAADFCQKHEPFGATDCKNNTYLVSNNVNTLRTTTKDKKLSADDYCSAQPAFDSITCAKPGYFENKTLYDQINAGKTVQADGNNVCSKLGLSQKNARVEMTHFDAKSNTKSFRSVKVKGQVNTSGDVSLKPVAQRFIETAKTPSSQRSSSTVYNNDKMDTGHNQGRLDQRFP